jgi:hypothetical protein
MGLEAPRSPSRSVVLAAVFGAVLIIQGCATTRPTTDNVAKFASSLDIASAGMRDAYALTAQVERRAAVAALSVKYVMSKTGPVNIDPQVQFTGAEIGPVKTYLDLLSVYARHLTYLTGNEPVARVDAATAELAQAMGGLSGEAFPNLDGEVVQRGLQGGQAIAAFLVEEKLNDALPPIIDRMQPQLESLTSLLKVHLSSLRVIAQIRVDEIGMARGVFLSAFRDDPCISSAQRLELFENAAADQAELAETDQLLAAAQDVLPLMERAHAALRSPASTSATAAVEAFESCGRRLSVLYQAVKRQ